MKCANKRVLAVEETEEIGDRLSAGEIDCINGCVHLYRLAVQGRWGVAHARPREFRSPDSRRSANCLSLAVHRGNGICRRHNIGIVGEPAVIRTRQAKLPCASVCTHCDTSIESASPREIMSISMPLNTSHPKTRISTNCSGLGRWEGALPAVVRADPNPSVR